MFCVWSLGGRGTPQQWHIFSLQYMTILLLVNKKTEKIGCSCNFISINSFFKVFSILHSLLVTVWHTCKHGCKSCVSMVVTVEEWLTPLLKLQCYTLFRTQSDIVSRCSQELNLSSVTNTLDVMYLVLWTRWIGWTQRSGARKGWIWRLLGTKVFFSFISKVKRT